VTGGDRIQRYELFDVGDAGQALGRFAELCAARAAENQDGAASNETPQTG
jgi:hypothetical protein